MNLTGTELLDDILDIHNDKISIFDKYARLRSLLERACKDQTSDETVRFTTLFTRLTFLCKKHQLYPKQVFQINRFRVNANKVLHENLSPTEEIYVRDLKALSRTISIFYKAQIPGELKSLQEVEVETIPPLPIEFKKIRVAVSDIDDSFIYVFIENFETAEAVKVKHHVNGINDLFNKTAECIWTGSQLNLLDVSVKDQILIPRFIVIEPDYLLDVTSIAETFKEYGNDPLNYLYSKFDSIPNNPSILLGHFANNTLDEFLFKGVANANFQEIVVKTFKQFPFEFSTCKEFENAADLARFKNDLNSQFENIKRVFENEFTKYRIEASTAIIEPSFVCEALGIQGRLDFLQEDLSKIIELKSGRANDWPIENIRPKENNRIQMLLYMGMLEYSIGIKHGSVDTYLFYSRYPILFNLAQALSELQKAINLRNLIVFNEYRLASDKKCAPLLLSSITPEQLNTNNLIGTLWEDYIRPQINSFRSVFGRASELELKYFYTFYSFVSHEHYLSKLQIKDLDNERNGSYWTDFSSKVENGEILYDLYISEFGNKSNHDDAPPTISFEIPVYEEEFLPNFRKGDVVIIYQRNNEKDNLTNKQVFKGSVEVISDHQISIRLRNKQKNQTVLPLNAKYAVEHDYLDSTYLAMYRGLYQFLQANKDRRELLLGVRRPTHDPEKYMGFVYDTVEIQQVVWKSIQANDYFLLIGPPGSGKTSKYLKSMVQEFYDRNSNILLLAYTNRAVDEICYALKSIDTAPSFMRIGSELSCDINYHEDLLEKKFKDCTHISQIKEKIKEHRIFVGTIASVSGKTDLFKLKSFDVAIVDEASQILEPSIVGILSAKTLGGDNAIKKFILIGDHKQLPAVVLQKGSESEVKEEILQNIGLTDCRVSLFERLYNLNKQASSHYLDLIRKQGRMHPEIAKYPNYCFYNNQLEVVPCPHQEIAFPINYLDTGNGLQKILTKRRLCFVHTGANSSGNKKVHKQEAIYAAKIAETVYNLWKNSGKGFDPNKTLGIITPYRSQIAFIRKEIRKLELPELNLISVDTVERYQGSEREVIIFSFTVSQYSQLDFLSNIIIDHGQIIDRKLNVAITRAREQLIVLGNPELLASNFTYFRLVEYIRSRNGYFNVNQDDFLSGNFIVEEADTDRDLKGKIFEPESDFLSAFNETVLKDILSDSSTVYPSVIYGNDHDYNRLNIIEYGRANFDIPKDHISPEKKVNLYCYYNMRKHYHSTIAIFESYKDFFLQHISNTQQRVTFIDLGCGPMTSGLAFINQLNKENSLQLNYIGIDISIAMLQKAKAFARSILVSQDTACNFFNSFDTVPESLWSNISRLPNLVIINCCYLFGNVDAQEAEVLGKKVYEFCCKYPLNKYILVFQNSALEKRNRTYKIFRKQIPQLRSTSMPKTETISYRNNIMNSFDKTETVYYEILISE